MLSNNASGFCVGYTLFYLTNDLLKLLFLNLSPNIVARPTLIKIVFRSRTLDIVSTSLGVNVYVAISIYYWRTSAV